MKLLKTIGVLLFPVFAAAQVNIIPAPSSIVKGNGSFELNAATTIVVYNGADQAAADYFNSYLQQFYNLKLKTSNKAESNFINFTTLQSLLPGKEGAYSLHATNQNISINGQTTSGTFYGMQTLIQLLPIPSESKSTSQKIIIPEVNINDAPRFNYRGVHLDVSRHFFPVDYIKKYIDFIAMHKMNYFHWHLTDDQGWRIEIKKYPLLTSIGGWRNGTIVGHYPGSGNDNIRYGGYYTQEQVKEIVAYASARYITVIPEIEMPGHVSAAIAAYPELSCFPDEPTFQYYPKECKWAGDTKGKQVQQTFGVFDDVYCAGKENTFTFLQNVIDEVLSLFPSRYIHIGGDECPKENWKRCPLCQKRMKENGLKDEHEVQSYFIQRMEKYINGEGRSIIGWDEILEGGLAPNATVMSWRGEEGGIEAAKQNHDVVMTPGSPLYLNQSQSPNEDSVTQGGYNSIEQVYKYDPVPSVLNADQAKHILGAQANLWTEYIAYPSKVEYMLFPRLSAASEVFWSTKENKNWDTFQQRLKIQFERYRLWKWNYSSEYFALQQSVLPSPNQNGVIFSLNSNNSDALFWGNFLTDKTKTLTSNPNAKAYKAAKLIPINKTGKYSWVVLNNSNVTVNKNSIVYTQAFYINKATGKKITINTPIAERYQSDGPFTLVNGIQAEKGFAQAKDYLGFNGNDGEAVIDLGTLQTISSITVHALDSRASWIYQPSGIEVYFSSDNKNYNKVGSSNVFILTKKDTGNGVLKLVLKKKAKTQFVKVLVKNFGQIPAGNPGAGNKAWLFLDEIEVQ